MLGRRAPRDRPTHGVWPIWALLKLPSKAEGDLKLTDNQFGALADFVYNIGVPEFNGSTVRKLLLHGKLSLIPSEFAKWLQLLLTLSVTSCTSGKGADSFCLAAHSIRPTAADVQTMSPALVQQVLTHDKTGQTLCGWKP